MTNTPYNPNDPEFLASRRLDEDLSDSEGKGLRAFEAGSPESARFVRDMHGVHNLIGQWGSRRVEVDESAFVEGVLGRIADDQAEETAGIDVALQSWRAQGVAVDEGAFVAQVTQRLEGVGSPSRGDSVTYRILRPLALAAVIGLAITALMWFQRGPLPVSTVSIQRSYVEAGAGDAGVDQPSRVVVFDRTALADARESRQSGRTSIIVIGTEAYEGDAADVPPL